VRPGQARALPREAGTSRRMPPTANPRRRAQPGRRSGHTARSSGRSGFGTRRGAAGPSGIHAGATAGRATVRASPSSTTSSSARAATSGRRKEKYLTSAPAHATDAADPRPATRDRPPPAGSHAATTRDQRPASVPTDHGPTPTHPQADPADRQGHCDLLQRRESQTDSREDGRSFAGPVRLGGGGRGFSWCVHCIYIDLWPSLPPDPWGGLPPPMC
jgi:hypothetical protein